MPRKMPEHIFGYNNSKQINTIHPFPLSSNTMFSSVSFLSIHLPTDGILLQSESSTHRAQYAPGCKSSQPVSMPSYHFSGLTGDTNMSMLYCVLSTPSLLMLFIRSMTCVLLISFIFLYFFWLIEERSGNSSQIWITNHFPNSCMRGLHLLRHPQRIQT